MSDHYFKRPETKTKEQEIWSMPGMTHEPGAVAVKEEEQSDEEKLVALRSAWSLRKGAC